MLQTVSAEIRIQSDLVELINSTCQPVSIKYNSVGLFKTSLLR